jgi:quercetin dioxygenase-like cupin family protein
MLIVEYLPGGASLPHRHDAIVFVYVLKGALTMQVEDVRGRFEASGNDYLGRRSK